MKLSEKTRTGDKRGPQGHRSGHYWARLSPDIPAKPTFGASLKPLFGQSQKGNSAKYVPRHRDFWSEASLFALLFLCTLTGMKGGLQFSE